MARTGLALNTCALEKMSIALAQLFFSGTLTQTCRKSPLFFVKFGTAIFWRIQCSTPQKWWFVQEDKHRMWSARSWLHIDLACELFCNSSQQCHVIGPTSSFLGCYLRRYPDLTPGKNTGSNWWLNVVGFDSILPAIRLYQYKQLQLTWM